MKEVMKNVLIVMCTNILGGAEHVLFDYLKSNRHHRFFILTNTNAETKQYAAAALQRERAYFHPAMHVISMRKHPLSACFYLARAVYQIHKIVKNNAIEVLYGNNTIDFVLISLYKRIFRTKVKVISHVHDIISRSCYQKYIQKNERYIDRFIVPSKACKDALSACIQSGNKIEVVYNGVDLPSANYDRETVDDLKSLYSIPKDKVVLGMVGQFCKRKRPDLFVKIIKELLSSSHSFFGIIVGSVSEKDLFQDIKDDCTRKLVPINFIGNVPRNEIDKVYACMDFLLLTSDSDPLPTVILEAMARKKIVIARDVDGVKEMIEDGKNGYMFPYDASAREIAEMISRIHFQNSGEAADMKKRMKKTLQEKFSNEQKKAIVNALIDEV